MKKLLVLVGCIAALWMVGAAGMAGCGGDEGCPGVTCTNCAGSGDCNIDCGDRVEVCGAHPDDSSLRCAYCE